MAQVLPEQDEAAKRLIAFRISQRSLSRSTLFPALYPTAHFSQDCGFHISNDAIAASFNFKQYRLDAFLSQ
jgi:hypothetical protein